jgi:hemerythrin
MMNASENLNAAGLLTEQRRAHGTLVASSVMQLCRSAMETSARTIWLLSDPEREVRRDRCMQIVMEQLKQQSQFLKIDEETEINGHNPRPQHIIVMNREHRRKHAELLKTLKETYTFTRPPSFTKTVRLAAQWIDAHIPAHDTGELVACGLEDGARAFYSYGSSFVHGYFWMTDYVRNGRLFGMIADSLAAAINMTECAVALYECACRGPAESRPDARSYVPERLEPTIAQWARELYQA